MAKSFSEENAMNIVAEELRHIFNFKKNMQILARKIGLLNRKQDDVQIALQGAELAYGRKRKRVVEGWLKDVDEKRRQFEELNQDIDRTRTYNIVARRHLAKQVAQEIDEVTQLVEQGNFPEGVVHDAVENKVMPLVISTTAKGPSFEKNFEHIWAWLMDDDVLTIGIYGMGGVGKTTLAMHLHDKLLHEPKFSNCVYWVTVSQESNNFKLQNDITKSMKIYVSGEDDEKKRAATLFKELNKIGKLVLILDDVWKQFDVGRIGLPPKKDVSKLVVTSRFANVCHWIGCQKLIKVEALSEFEAWELFRQELGQTMDAPKIKEIARNIAKKCGRLPLGIITMARRMRGVTEIHGWKDAHEELKESCMSQENMETEALPILLCSFKRLRNQKLQLCFLLLLVS